MANIFLVSTLILSGLTLCTGQDTAVDFHMNGITGSAVFSFIDKQLMVTLNLSQSLGTGPANVEIRPIWVDYDVADKCSTIQLGSAIPGLITSVTFINNTAVATFQNVESLLSLGGCSIVVNGSSKAVCASIESDQNHPTAVAQFHNLIQGTVYFRQSFDSSHTRIVSDLFSGQSAYNGSWLISDTVDNCSLVTSMTQLKEFNPSISTGSGCAQTSQESCAVGQLSGKLGDVTIGVNKKENRLSYNDKNLPSINDLNGKLLLIKSSNNSFACAVIRVFSTRKAMVEFSHDGITGSITFSQPNPFDSTTTAVNLMGLNYMAKGYHVHLWPTPTKIVYGQDLCGDNIVSGHFNPYNKNVKDGYPTPDNSTDDMYETGDLSSKYGTLENVSALTYRIYTDWNLPLYGQNSIIGRSLVIHHNDDIGSRWVCANIQPVGNSLVAAIAIFKYPVIGQIMFIQEESRTETSVFAQLDYNDGRSGTKNHTWMINTNMITNDMLLTDESLRCLSGGTTYTPENVMQLSQAEYIDYCKKNSPLGCKLGDLSGKLGFLNIRSTASSETSTKQFFTDVNLPLSGLHSIIGKSVTIMNEQGTSKLACANIQILRSQNLSASFSMGNISGNVVFQQMAGFGAKTTMVSNDLGLGEKNRLWIYELPPHAKNDCSGLGNVFNPLNVTQSASLTATDDKYPIGDLSHYGTITKWNGFNLPLMGLTSINKRSLVVVDQTNQNKVVACAKIDNVVSPDSSQNVEAVSTFTGTINGTIHLFQTIYSDGTMSDTSILVNLSRPNGQESLQHNWHTHINPIGDDVPVVPCKSAGVHFDPYMTILGVPSDMTNYDSECRPDNPLRCEVGDQASKLSRYNVGGGQKLYTDIDLPLSGKNSVQGRSIVLHEQERAAARLACADIIPITADAVTVKIRSASSLDRLAVAKVYAEAINADPTNIVIEFISQKDDTTEVRVHFLGFQRTTQRDTFVAILNGKNKDSLNPYAPYTGAAYYTVVSTALLLAVFAVQLLNYL